MTPEVRLQSLFEAATPPVRDYGFEAEVARRVALRRAWLTAAALVPWTVVGSVLLWAVFRAVGPLLETTSAALAPTAMAVTVAGVVVAGAQWLAARFNEA